MQISYSLLNDVQSLSNDHFQGLQHFIPKCRFQMPLAPQPMPRPDIVVPGPPSNRVEDDPSRMSSLLCSIVLHTAAGTRTKKRSNERRIRQTAIAVSQRELQGAKGKEQQEQRQREGLRPAGHTTPRGVLGKANVDTQKRIVHREGVHKGRRGCFRCRGGVAGRAGTTPATVSCLCERTYVQGWCNGVGRAAPGGGLSCPRH